MSVTGVTRYGERLHILPPAGATRAQGWFLFLSHCALLPLRQFDRGPGNLMTFFAQGHKSISSVRSAGLFLRSA